MGILVLNSEFSAYSTVLKDHSLPNYLLIDGGRFIGAIPFLSVLMLCEMQTH